MVVTGYSPSILMGLEEQEVERVVVEGLGAEEEGQEELAVEALVEPAVVLAVEALEVPVVVLEVEASEGPVVVEAAEEEVVLEVITVYIAVKA